MLVRTWNLFHGNTVPPARREQFDEMLARVRADDVDVLCAQEVPAWALDRFTCGRLAARPAIGPFPITSGLGHRLTRFNHGRLRSAFSGQGNGILLDGRYELLSTAGLALNPRRFRDRHALTLRLGVLPRIVWAHERRVVHSIRFRTPDDGRTFFVANAHCTSYDVDRRLAEAELLRAAWFARSTAAAGDVVVLAGDFNLTARSAVLRSLTDDEWGFSALGPGIDHVLVHGAPSSPPRSLPEEWRRHGNVLLSDHAPVEVEVG